MNHSTDYEDVADVDSVVDGDPAAWWEIDVDSKVIVQVNFNDADVIVQLKSNDDDFRNDFVDKQETRDSSVFLKAWTSIAGSHVNAPCPPERHWCLQ